MPDTTSPPTSAAPPWSKAAIAAFALSIVACCPPASVLAIGVAIVALLRISRSPVPLRGRNLAIAAIALGGVGLFGTAAAMQWHDRVYRRQLDAAMIAELEGIIESAQRGDGTAVRDRWAEGVARPTPLAAADFGVTIGDRYGGLRGVSIVRQQTGGSILAPTMEVALTLSFERRTLVGSAAFTLVPIPGSVHPEVRLRTLDVEDSRGGNLQLP